MFTVAPHGWPIWCYPGGYPGASPNSSNTYRTGLGSGIDQATSVGLGAANGTNGKLTIAAALDLIADCGHLRIARRLRCRPQPCLTLFPLLSVAFTYNYPRHLRHWTI